ncbi:MAG: hypothetical protein ACERKJ_03590 [Candidatus Dadabacteria bacterium]|jgi:hypothetical protein
MDTGILWSLISSFTSVFVLTRILQYLLKRTNLEDRTRAYVVFFVVAVFDLIGLYFYFDGITLALQGWLFYYLPFLVMWLFKDLMEASRKKKQEEAAQEEQSVK